MGGVSNDVQQFSAAVGSANRLAAVSFLGIEAHPIPVEELVAAIDRAVTHEEKIVVAHHNMHSLYLFHHHAEMRRYYERADIVHFDGMILIALARLLGLPVRPGDRATYLDLIGPLLEKAHQGGWKLFFLGSKPGVAEKGAEVWRRTHPGLRIEVADGYFDVDSPVENGAILARIERFSPDVLFVGMSMPRQEQWILRNLAAIEARTIMSSGAIMDYVAGVAPTPPRWLGRIGLEWLYRLLTAPRHLWRRYLVEPWFILGLLLRRLGARLRGGSA